MLQNTSHTKAKCNTVEEKQKNIKHSKENLRNLFSQVK